MLDANEHYMNNSMELTFIDPNPQRLLKNIKPLDREKVEIIPERLQDTDLSIFSSLGPSDILFVDSSHVLKIDSELNLILFEILPALNTGVYVHFHDIFYPFQYLRNWVKQGRAWNEAYALRAFLQYNTAFEVILFNNYLRIKHQDRFLRDRPLFENGVGGSLWLKKTG
jgi:hypothetical protein